MRLYSPSHCSLYFLWSSFSILSCLCPFSSLRVDSTIAYWGSICMWMESGDGPWSGGLSFSRDSYFGSPSNRCQHYHVLMGLHHQISSRWYHCTSQDSSGCSWIYLRCVLCNELFTDSSRVHVLGLPILVAFSSPLASHHARPIPPCSLRRLRVVFSFL